MYQSGKVDIRVLKDILGHEQLNTTQIYTHVVSRNLEEAVEYHKAMPESRQFSKKLLDAKRAGRTLIQPRAGVPVVEEHIKLMQYLEKNGEADLLPSTIDSYTRQNRYEEAENGISESIRLGRAM